MNKLEKAKQIATIEEEYKSGKIDADLAEKKLNTLINSLTLEDLFDLDELILTELEGEK